MKTTKIRTRAGVFTIIIAARGTRGATRDQIAHALEVAINRVSRAERRFEILRKRRLNKRKGNR